MVDAAATGEPIGEAMVEVLDGDGDVIATLTADEDGAFTLAGLAPGDYTLLADAAGYATSDPVTEPVPSDGTVVLTLQVAQPPVQLPSRLLDPGDSPGCLGCQ